MPWNLLTRLEITLVALVSAQAVLVAFLPQTPPVVEWTSRIFGIVGFVAGVVKIVLLANGQPAAKPVVK